jgi:pimeloyl-ACP methyl ester carboxylesterase
MQRVTTPDGNRVAVHDLGGAGPTLLLAHATGFHGHVWEPVAIHLSNRFHCIAFDERGHGDSDPAPGGDYDWNGFATDALAVIDGLDLAADGPLLAAGHSCGGALLLLAEQRRPGTFAALWTYEPVMVPFDGLPTLEEQGKNPLAAGARKRRATFASTQAAFDNYAGKPPFSVLDPAALRAYVEHGFARQPDGTVRLKCEPESEARTYEMGMHHEAFGGLPKVECPVTVVCGEVTDAFPEPVIRVIAERLPAGRADVLTGLGHFGPLQDPAAIAASIEAALG